ncbi:MAG: type II secretion system protein [Candidatus Pacebacteria bacterium]|nr:type II secretion system protein [Candidatus Paceibacterota bacterium]
MRRAFTLIETLVTIAIFALTMGVVSTFIVLGYKTQSYASQQAVAIGEARKGIETLVREIREAKSGEDGSYVIEQADDYEFIFYSNIDDDSASEKIRYFIDGTNFKKGVTDPSGSPPQYFPASEKITVLSEHVVNSPPVFHYYDGDGLEIVELPARPKDTKLMRVYLVVNVDLSRAPQSYELESSVQIRNLKDNL